MMPTRPIAPTMIGTHTGTCPDCIATNTSPVSCVARITDEEQEQRARLTALTVTYDTLKNKQNELIRKALAGLHLHCGLLDPSPPR
jgi:hypothetical protein